MRIIDPDWHTACLALLFLTGYNPGRDDKAAYRRRAYDVLRMMIGGDGDDPT